MAKTQEITERDQPGRVKWFNDKANYGFISRPGEGDAPAKPDVFVHRKDVTGEILKPGEVLRFDVAITPKGEQAINLVRG